jgi:hypothetical protein
MLEAAIRTHGPATALGRGYQHAHLGAVMKSIVKHIILGLALAVSLAAMGRAEAAEKYRIDHEVWGWYQQYLRNIGNGNKPGAFAITKDGHGAFYSWCQDIRCVAGTTYSQDAINYCEREYGGECVIFAVRDDIKVEYEIVASSAPSASDMSDREPPPVITINVSPSVKSDIDAYLRNQGAGRTWALAIARDGSNVEVASCRTIGSYRGGTPCDRAKGSLQQQTNREALNRCGADDCVLLYAGTQKQENIEIVAQ